MSRYEEAVDDLLEKAQEAASLLRYVHEKMHGDKAIPTFHTSGTYSTNNPQSAAKNCIMPVTQLVTALRDTKNFNESVKRYNGV